VSDEKEWWSGTKARVFVSCGQASVDERTAAARVRGVLQRLGFCPFVGVEAHSSKGLTTNIYEHLATAEYFLFIDFRREPIGTEKAGHHRGSLFSHQELGIASFLDSELLPFVQDDVRLEGILAHVQGNGIPFSDLRRLSRLVRSEVVKAKWDPNHRRELRIDVGPPVKTRAILPSIFRIVTAGQYEYYHFRLRNLHSRILATNCMIQVVSCRGPTFSDGHPVDVIELKFTHITLPTVALPPRSVRLFDAAIVRMDPARAPLALPGMAHPTYVDSEALYLQYAMIEPGDYEIDLQVHSREFGSGVQTMRIHLGRTWEETLIEIGPKHKPEVHAAANRRPAGLSNHRRN
jgi:hypothetical protein